MRERTRVAAIIIQDNRLLLVKGSDKYKEYWTPGGTQEKGESDVETLRRELNEEIHVNMASAVFFGEYTALSPYVDDEMVVSKAYIVAISGEIKTANEIQNHVWMTKKEFEEGKYPLVATTRGKIIPDIIKAGYF